MSRESRIEIVAAVIMDAPGDNHDGCPVCGYGAWGPNKALAEQLAGFIVDALDKGEDA